MVAAAGCIIYADLFRIVHFVTSVVVVVLCYTSSTIVVTRKGAGKAIQLQAWTGPEGSRRLRFPDFKTTGT